MLGGEVPNERDVTLWNWNTAVAGGKGSVYWQYAPEPSGLELPGFGLTGFLGENTERSKAAGRAAAHLNQPVLDGAGRRMPMNAIYVSRHSELLCFSADRKEELYAGSISGVYKAAYMAGIPVRFFHEDYIEELLLSGIKTLYLPMPLVLSEKEVDIFHRFVELGGVLITEACPGLYRQDGLLEQGGVALNTLFGIHHKEIQAIPESGKISSVGKDDLGEFTGQLYRQLIIPGEQTAVLAEFPDGEPSVTEFGIGKGKAIWIGTYPGYCYEHTGEAETGKLLIHWFHKNGYDIIKRIHISDIEEQEILLAPVIRLLETDREYVLIVVNHTYQKTDICVEFHDEQRIDESNYEGRKLYMSIAPSAGQIYHWKKDSAE
ncbi:hypothetical protein HNQ56_000467 [Anaerotaenia torta]|uniref:beta-galactosidase trimerization domain-containing protein n=1 Tax=Anaerotaenia torta TaxID=433293 RepID=UPI003D21DBE6